MVYSVSIWLKISPPMMVIPSGRRSSDPVPVPSASGSAPKQRRHGGHQDGPETQQAGLEDRIARALAFIAFGGDRKIDHQDRVLLHDADQQDDSDDRDHAQIGVRQLQGQQRAHARRRQRGQDRHRMNVAFIQHAEHDVDRRQRGGDQQRLAAERVLIGLRRACEPGLDGGGQADFVALPR